MTKKEKQALQALSDIINNLVTTDDKVYQTDEDGACTHDAMVHGSWLRHIDRCLKQSIDKGQLIITDPI